MCRRAKNSPRSSKLLERHPNFGDRLAEVNERLSSELGLGNQAVVEFDDRVRADYAPE